MIVFHGIGLSLCNISYKSISKLLVNKVQMILPKIISPMKSAFVMNKAHDNILIAYEILTSFWRNVTKNGYIAIKLDVEKNL